MSTNSFSFKPNLLFCIIMDAIGYFTYALPGLGEFGDIIWAPLSGFIFYKTFGGTKGLIGGILNAIEEALPFTDFIPSFTIMYFIQNKGK
ncbi:MAG: hypothetical protein IPP48_08655 [Chitinophagaceae bacterium]|nr:hypothetical protein [Chitinophagaceae bacterium]